VNTRKISALALIVAAALCRSALADGVQEYGTENVLGTGTYASDPKAGTTLEGLAPGVSTASTLITPHGFPFAPAAGDYPGTDQIYVGSVQTGAHDGYSTSAERINGPDLISMDYSGLVGAGTSVSTLTLGIAFDDFQNAVFGQPFTLMINGQTDTALTALANSLNETTPVVQFYTIGISTSELNSSNMLDLSIDEGGDGGDGYAVDFLTIGVTTVPASSTPLPASLAMGLVGMLGVGALVLRQRRTAAV